MQLEYICAHGNVLSPKFNAMFECARSNDFQGFCNLFILSFFHLNWICYWLTDTLSTPYIPSDKIIWFLISRDIEKLGHR